MKALFKQMGFDVARQADAEALYFAQLLDDSLNIGSQEWMNLISLATVFQDVPFSTSNFLPWLLRHYPEALYIHVSRFADDWYQSLIRHHITRRLMVTPKFDDSGSLVWSEEIEMASNARRYRGIPLHLIVAARYGTPTSDPYRKTALITNHEFQQRQAQVLLADRDSILLSLDDLRSGVTSQLFNKRFGIDRVRTIPHMNNSAIDPAMLT